MKEAKWYALKVKGGREKAVKEAVEKLVANQQWGSSLVNLVVPVQKTYKTVAGKRKSVTQHLGYLFLEVDLTACPGLVQLLREIEGIYGFMQTAGYGFSESPLALDPEEIDRMLGKIDKKNVLSEEDNQALAEGDTVRIIDGLLEGSEGTVEKIFKEKRKVVVSLKFFGSWKEAEVSDTQIEKIK